MNYDKWSKLDADGEEEEENCEIDAEIERLKTNADGLFDANESGVGSVSYKECVGHYQRVIHLINDNKDYLELSIRCHLNLSCCFIRESEWLLAINHGKIAFQLCSHEHWNEQLRARYFELHSLCRLVQQTEHVDKVIRHAQLVQAEKYASEMKKSIQFHAALVSPEHIADYEHLFKQLGECVARVERDIEAVAESHFEKAQQLQRSGNNLQAAAELAKCAELTQSLRTPSHLSSSAKMHVLVAVIRFKYREYATALQHYTLALTLSTSEHTSFDVVSSVATFGVTACNLKLHRELHSTAVDTFNTTCTLEMCVFDSSISTTNDSNSVFLSHILTPAAHIIEAAGLFATHTHIAHSVHSATDTVQYAFILHLLRGYSLLADTHAQLGNWELCSDVTDRTIDTCNALIAQFSPKNTTAGTTDPTNTTTTTNIITYTNTTSSTNIRTVLLSKRAECFVAKAMLVKDHSHAISTHITSTTTTTANTTTNTTNSDPIANTTNTNTTYAWPKVVPLHTKHTLPTQYNTYAAFHRLHFDSTSEAVAVLLQVAGAEYEAVDSVQSMRTFRTLAEYIMHIAKIQPFEFDTNSVSTSSTMGTMSTTTNGITTTYSNPNTTNSSSSSSSSDIDKKDLAERAAEAWQKVSLQATRQVTSLNSTLSTTLTTNPAAPYTTLRTHYFDKYYYMQQSMLALYYAGVCSVWFDSALSQRHFEASEEVRRDIDAVLSGELKSEFNLGQPASKSSLGDSDGTGSSTSSGSNSIKVEPYDFGDSDKSISSVTDLSTNTTTANNTTTSNATSAESRSLHGYYSACGDVAYHLAQVYLRRALYTEALSSASAALAYYEHSERLLYLLNTLIQSTTHTNNKAHNSMLTMGVVGLHLPLSETSPMGRLRQRMSLVVCLLCHSARGEERLVQQGLRRLGDLCLGPIEDGEAEVASVKRQLSQQQRSIEREMGSGGRDSPASVPAPLAVDGNMVRNIRYNYDSDTEASANNSAKSAKSSTLKGNSVSGTTNSGISNVRMERVPNPVKRRFDYNLLIAYSIVSVVVIAIVVAVFSK